MGVLGGMGYAIDLNALSITFNADYKYTTATQLNHEQRGQEGETDLEFHTISFSVGILL